MNPLFPYDNIVIGVLILIVGFLFHWIGQLISVFNWDLAMKLGIQEKHLPAEFKVYEHGTAKADVAIGWSYGIIGIGVVFNANWCLELAWFPGVILFYHAICYWFWTQNQQKAGYQSEPYRVVWFLMNLITGILSMGLAWRV